MQFSSLVYLGFLSNEWRGERQMLAIRDWILDFSDFCARRLVSLYTYLWLTSMLIQTFFIPAWWVVREHHIYITFDNWWRTKARKCFSCMSLNDGYKRTTNQHLEAQKKITSYANVILLPTIIFAPYVPVLIFSSLLAIGLQLVTERWLVNSSKDSPGELVSRHIFAVAPVTAVWCCYHLGVWVVNLAILLDLQFSYAVLGSYVGFACVELVATSVMMRRAGCTLRFREVGAMAHEVGATKEDEVGVTMALEVGAAKRDNGVTMGGGVLIPVALLLDESDLRNSSSVPVG